MSCSPRRGAISSRSTSSGPRGESRSGCGRWPLHLPRRGDGAARSARPCTYKEGNMAGERRGTLRRAGLLATPLAISALILSGAALAATVVGTAKNDVLRGTAKADKLLGKGGNDKLYGKGGNDVLVGGAGKDLLVGG